MQCSRVVGLLRWPRSSLARFDILLTQKFNPYYLLVLSCSAITCSMLRPRPSRHTVSSFDPVASDHFKVFKWTTSHWTPGGRSMSSPAADPVALLPVRSHHLSRLAPFEVIRVEQRVNQYDNISKWRGAEVQEIANKVLGSLEHVAGKPKANTECVQLYLSASGRPKSARRE